MDNFYSIKEVTANYIKGCEGKIHSKNHVIFGKAILAGMMIALGASGSSVAAHAIGNVGIARVVAGVVFPMGLMMVILMGAELFTGDCLMVMGDADKKYKVLDLLRVWFFVYIGNFVGSMLLVLLIVGSGQLNYSAGLLGAYTIKVALGKTGHTFTQGITSGILCNILVCAAVLMAGCAKDVAGKLLASFFMILLFVTSGFEHCVANMYYIPAGLMAKLNPDYCNVAAAQYGLTADKLEALNIQNFAITNLVPVTIGNIIGGVFIGLAVYYLQKAPNKN